MILLTATANTWAADSLAFKQHTISLINRVKMVIPRSQNADRVYVTSAFQQHVVKVTVLIDNQTLVYSIGTTQTTSMPLQLMQGYGKQYTELAAFSITPFKDAKTSIVIGFQLENGKEKKVSIKNKDLAKLLNDLP